MEAAEKIIAAIATPIFAVAVAWFLLRHQLPSLVEQFTKASKEERAQFAASLAEVTQTMSQTVESQRKDYRDEAHEDRKAFFDSLTAVEARTSNVLEQLGDKVESLGVAVAGMQAELSSLRVERLNRGELMRVDKPHRHDLGQK